MRAREATLSGRKPRAKLESPVRTNIYIPRELLNRAKEEAAAFGLSLSEYVRGAMESELSHVASQAQVEQTRLYLAGTAMLGILSSDGMEPREDHAEAWHRAVARQAVAHADAMLAALRPPEPAE